MVEKIEFKHLHWDTDYFGINSARININGELSEKERRDILLFCNKYEFITFANNNNNYENNRWIGEGTSAFLTDTNLQFVKKVKLEDNESHSDNVKIYNNYPKNEQILNISRKAFNHSRFFQDKYLPVIKTRNIYSQWTESAFNSTKKYFAVFELNNIAVGYILFSIYNDSGIIELIAVSEKYQKQNIGKTLLTTMSEFLFKNNIDLVKVGTQINNINAINFYCKNGFNLLQVNSIYHWHKESI